jgi:hypothetical protein
VPLVRFVLQVSDGPAPGWTRIDLHNVLAVGAS